MQFSIWPRDVLEADAFNGTRIVPESPGIPTRDWLGVVASVRTLLAIRGKKLSPEH